MVKGEKSTREFSGERGELSRNLLMDCSRGKGCERSQLLGMPSRTLMGFSYFPVSFQCSLTFYCCTWLDCSDKINSELILLSVLQNSLITGSFSKSSTAPEIKPTTSKIVMPRGRVQ